MKLKIDIEIDNDAFTEDFDRELTRLLKMVQWQASTADQRYPDRANGNLKDTNGNTVGRWWFEQ